MSVVFLCVLGAVIYALYMVRSLMTESAGNEAMKAIAGAIHEGACAYLNRQYKVIFFIGVLIAFSLTALLGVYVGLGFAVGAILSGLAGYIGMHVSVRANVRTAQAARVSLKKALKLSFDSGAITGLLVVALGLLSVAGYYFYLKGLSLDTRTQLEALVSLSFGASLISIFARLGGGIFTKGADVGADMVGKIEAGIPEDDPSNPAVIADNVGDNVGDCAGMAADLFETYVVTLVGTMLLAGIYFKGPSLEKMLLFPMLIAGVCIAASVVGSFFVKLGPSENVMGALYKGFIATLVFSAAALFYLCYSWIGFDQVFYNAQATFSGQNLFVCTLIGLAVTGLLMKTTEYYTMTHYRPVKSIALSSASGHGTNIIQGIAISMEATALPVIIISAGILIAFQSAGLFGIAIAATTMLAVAGMVVALDAFGPVTDNAGGIAQMAGLDSQVRKITDTLDAVGNTTKAVTKGYAIGSAGFAALVLFSAFLADLTYYFPNIQISFSLSDPYVMTGLFVGGLLPYLFGAMSMMAVGRAAQSVVFEVRRQFADNPDLKRGIGKADHTRAVDILTKNAIREMVLPSLLPVLAPILAYGIIYFLVGQTQAFVVLGSMLLGLVITGLFVGLSMTSGGGAWDNAKKHIEDGFFGGKGSEAHKAAITGDTVGDPYKDTAGPAINPMIKIANIVALLLLATLGHIR
ncbi:MAG: sodium-translocating pyrophosphatase [Myxococcales bacterium]|nr:MAG: sodium-translocating pyrophosphatase [Myxococcales bacterium]